MVVAVEGRRHALAVVVGRLQHVGCLHPIHPHEKAVLRRQHAGHPRQELTQRVVGMQVRILKTGEAQS